MHAKHEGCQAARAAAPTARAARHAPCNGFRPNVMTQSKDSRARSAPSASRSSLVVFALALLAVVYGCNSSPSTPESPPTLHAFRVLGVSRTHADKLLEVQTSNDRLLTTPEHPFFVAGRGWVPAARLEPGDRLDGSASEHETRVLSIREQVRPRTPVFNLLIDRSHSYRVGTGGVLVHNGDCSDGSDSSSSEDESPSHLSRKDLARLGVTREEKRALRDWSLKSFNLRSLSIALSEHPELAGMSYAEAEARGLLRTIDLGHSGEAGMTREREFELLRRQLLVDLPSLMQKLPKYRGTVYRGLKNIPAEQIAEWRSMMLQGHTTQLGMNGGPGYTSGTDRLIVAQRFARMRYPEPGRVSVVFEIEQRSAVSVRALSLARPEGEMLIPEGTHFRITSIEETAPNTFKVHMVEV